DELLAGYHGYPGERLLSLLENRQFFDMLRFAKNWSRWPGRKYRHAWMFLGKVIFSDGIYKNARKMLGRNFSPSWLKADLLRDEKVYLNEKRMPLKNDARGLRVIERLSDSLQNRGLPKLLRHADRNSMRFSLESRVPFLTIPMVELVHSLPENYLIANSGETKRVFRAAMRGIVPDDVLDRRDKLGFSTPERKWILDSAPAFREWLQMSDKVPFINQDDLLENFDSIVAGRAPYTKKIWRWVNYVRWYSMLKT
ncbi:MAG: asparagine synthase, partial [Candidatus Electrothrix sp. ATG2]|nr:asparagine synthase [Candidatus Electrothrix sp. ATG2]